MNRGKSSLRTGCDGGSESDLGSLRVNNNVKPSMGITERVLENSLSKISR